MGARGLMPELPSSWNLTTRPRGDGKLDIMGKDDAGREYRVRTTDAPGVTEHDIAEISAVDRERTNAREFVRGLMDNQSRINAAREARFQDSLEDAAGPVVRAGLEREGSTVGYSRPYAANFDKTFGDNQ